MSEFYTRVIKPVLIPLSATAVIAVIVFALSRIMLASPEIGSTTIALVAATVIVIVGSVVATAGRLAAAQRVLLALALVGLLGGGAAALDLGVRTVEGHAEEIEIAAVDIKFDTDFIEFPEEKPVALVFHNNDVGIPHNVTVAADDAFGEIIAQKDPFPGVASQTYDIDPLAVGTYFFRCDVHPTMAGTIGVGEAGPVTPKPSATDSPKPNPTPTNTDTPGPSAPVNIAAKDIVFNSDTMAFNANAPSTIVFDNQDGGVPHNVAIYENADFSGTIFQGELITGVKKVTYAFTAPAAGTYFFKCDVHPPMKGTVDVT